MTNQNGPVKPLFGNKVPSNQPATTSSFVEQQMKNNPHVSKVALPLNQVQQPIASVGVTTHEKSVTNFAPVSPKQLANIGASSQRVVNLLATFDNPTGILEYGQDIMTRISDKSTQLLNEVKDADVEFVQNHMSQLLTMTKKFHLKPQNQGNPGGLHGLINRVKEALIDTKEQLLSEYNDISTQMDRILAEVEQANGRILKKVSDLQVQYKDNLKDFNDFDIIIKDAIEAQGIKQRELDEMREKAVASGDINLTSQIDRLSRNIDRLDKKIANFKKFQLMCMQDAPDFANMEDSAVTLLEKFHTIKTMVIPLWKKQIRKYIDGQEIAKAAYLANSVDDATNQMIIQSSNANKANAVTVAKLGQRQAIDDDTAEQVHQNLIETLADVLEINEKGRQARIDSSTRQDQMKAMYASISSGQLSAVDAKALTNGSK
jgi:uncharacterized protein YaaN involved in tellurite resistance